MHAEHAQLDQQIADMQEKKRKLEAKMLEEQLALEMERDTDGEEDEDGESELDVGPVSEEDDDSTEFNQRRTEGWDVGCWVGRWRMSQSGARC